MINAFLDGLEIRVKEIILAEAKMRGTELSTAEVLVITHESLFLIGKQMAENNLTPIYGAMTRVLARRK